MEARTGEAARADVERDACPPCRGTGKVISQAGGQPHQVTCPWCGGSGRRRPPGRRDEAG